MKPVNRPDHQALLADHQALIEFGQYLSQLSNETSGPLALHLKLAGLALIMQAFELEAEAA